MKIYTRTGDGGDTGLRGGRRISKAHTRIAAYGAVDEANSAIGVAASRVADASIRDALVGIQADLFLAGADLSNPDLGDCAQRVSAGMVRNLEGCIDIFEQELEPLANFILPGGAGGAAEIHHARAVTRRAETLAVRLSETDEINESCIIYLNRLSDLLFVLGRLANKRADVNDIVWKGDHS